MSTTTERKVTVASGLGDADASQVMAGTTFSSESGFNQEGKFIPSAGNITYNNATSKLGSTNTQGAIDEIVTLTNESGHSIDVTLNKSTYVMTISLKDKNGEVLNEKTVDFPMETAFVNASYDKASKTMKFTLESGSTVDVPLGDLVEGLVSQTDFDVLSGEVETLKTEVNNNTNAIVDVNSSMSDYGLNNVFDGELEQGGIDSGTKVVKDNYVITKNKIYCSPYDFIKSKGDNLESSYACFYKSDGTYIGGLNALDGCTAPSDSAYCYVEFIRSGITPSTAGHIGVYVNNQIDVVKNDVDNKYIDTFYLGSNSSTTFDISERVKIGYPIMIMVYPIDDQPGIWNYVGVIMPSSLNIYIVTLNSSNIEVTMDSNYIITVKNTNNDWGTHFKMRLI